MKNTFKKLTLAVAIATATIGTSSTVFAQNKVSEQRSYPSSVEIRQMTQDAPEAFKTVLNNGEQIISTFDADNGYTGYVVSAGGQNVILYYDNESDLIFSGAMIDKFGNNLSQQHYATQIPKRDYSNVLDMVQKSDSYITEGQESAPAEIYVFLDPECPHCHTFWESTRKFVDNGSLKVHWLPVAFLTQDSLGKVAAFVQSEDPVSGLNEGEKSFREGGLVPLKEEAIKDSTMELADQNIQFMRSFDSNGTPTIVYKTTEGKVYTIDRSIPEDELQELIDSISKKDS